MKLKHKLIISYTVLAVFLAAELIFSYHFCDIICRANLMSMNTGMSIFIFFSLISLIIALCVSLYFATKISDPLKILTAKTKDIANGNYKEKIELKTNTYELDALIGSVNNLAASLESQQSLKKRMAMDYAHEFRTPLAAIQSNLEGIIDGVFEPDNERIESIRQEIIRLSRMVSDIDKITELQNANLTLQKEDFNFCELLKQNITTFEAELQDKNITLNINAETCGVYADKDKISSVILNLISNAIKYTEMNGNIDITVKEEKDSIIFSVADNGIGIGKADLPHVFDYLYRADVSRARNTGGSGIGLSVIKAVIEAHGGKIEINSDIGVGSIFTITLKKR